MKDVLSVVGARPNFMKMAPVLRALEAYPGIRSTLIHTGQHYDEQLSEVFFEELGLPRPDRDLEVGSDSHGRQTGRIMGAFDDCLDEMAALGRTPSLVVVAGDVNSTMACALVAVKRGIPVAHVEAGLRSLDRTMPEEINRIVTDAVSTLLFTTSPEAAGNLIAEGVASEKIHFVGNPMIDSLREHMPSAVSRRVHEGLGLRPGGYVLVTLHRPSNVDDPAGLARILDTLRELSRQMPVVFPVHPRTRARIEALEAGETDGAQVGGATSVDPPPTLQLLEPLGYLDFVGLMATARFVLTDSGGIQEETSILGVPCLTLRANTERPITITQGTNRLLGTNPDAILPAAELLLATEPPLPRMPDLWDGHAGERIASVIAAWLRVPASSETTTAAR